ncbi:MAG: CdaR family protein [Thermodesulfobacteriota bacterium]
MKKSMTDNAGLKFAALALAVVLWLLVGGKSEAEVGFLVPLELRGVPADMVMATTPPGSIEIRVTGPRKAIGKLSPADVRVDIDLSSAREGLNSFRISSYDVEVPGGISVVSVNPVKIDIRMEPQGYKGPGRVEN